MAQFAPRRALTDEVQEWIRAGIIQGELPAGSTLTLQGIADRLGVSFTPIREALANLEPSGLVVREARKGYRVAEPLGRDDLLRLLDIRLALEPLAAQRAAESVLAGADAGELAGLVSRQSMLLAQVQASPDFDADLHRQYTEVDAEFHRTILGLAGNHFLERIANTLSSYWHRNRQMLEHGLTVGSEAVQEHATVAEAIVAGDGAAASRAMREHVARVRASVEGETAS